MNIKLHVTSSSSSLGSSQAQIKDFALLYINWKKNCTTQTRRTLPRLQTQQRSSQNYGRNAWWPIRISLRRKNNDTSAQLLLKIARCTPFSAKMPSPRSNRFILYKMCNNQTLRILRVSPYLNQIMFWFWYFRNQNTAGIKDSASTTLDCSIKDQEFKSNGEERSREKS